MTPLDPIKLIVASDDYRRHLRRERWLRDELLLHPIRRLTEFELRIIGDARRRFPYFE